MERTRENYKEVDITPNYHDYPVPKMSRTGWVNPADNFWCKDGYNLDSLSPALEKDLKRENPNFTTKGIIGNQSYVSRNQKLVGSANPKTLISPVVAPPAAEFNFWKVNNLITPSIINEQSQIDEYQSGYRVMTQCAPTLNNWVEFSSGDENKIAAQNQVMKNLGKVNFREDYKQATQIEIPTGNLEYNGDNIRFDYPYLEIPNDEVVILPGGQGQVNGGCGYNPEQLFTSDLPANLPAGNAEKSPRMKEYNKNIFTQTIQPGVYTRSQVNEPINSNIGISFTQQFEPLTSSVNPITGEIIYTEHDPRIIDPSMFTQQPPLVETNATESNIYDPRFSGYGTSYRSYNDEKIGQTRFYYDDVNAIRMPNYIVRSNIDREPFADRYGPIPEGDEFGNKDNNIIRGLANNAFLDSSLEFRNDLQERLMRKSNARAWQQRQMPIRTGGGQKLTGGIRIV